MFIRRALSLIMASRGCGPLQPTASLPHLETRPTGPRTCPPTAVTRELFLSLRSGQAEQYFKEGPSH